MPAATYRGLGAPSQRIVFLSTASTVLTLVDADQGALLVWNGQSSASRFILPAPSAGMAYEFLFNGPAVSSATKVIANTPGTYDILFHNTTGVAIAVGTTAEFGASYRLVAINDARWAAFQDYGSTVDSINLESTTT